MPGWSRSGDLLVVTARGLYCPEGDFFIDPSRPAPGCRAVITHAHSDHARAGAGAYLCSHACRPLLRCRLGSGIQTQTLGWGEPLRIGGVTVALHPAGHVLGSAQVRVQRVGGGPAWVVSGDYKTTPDRVCEPFQPVACDVFITESTFGLPIYQWPDPAGVLRELVAWWEQNARDGVTSVVRAYTLGKAQRVLAGVAEVVGAAGGAGPGPLLVGRAVEELCVAYEAAGVKLPPRALATEARVREARGRALVVGPVAPADDGPAAPTRTAACSGWARTPRSSWSRAGSGGAERGFVLSDHADWPGLLSAIAATGAGRVGVTHGFAGPLARWLRGTGLDAAALPQPRSTPAQPEAPGSDGP